MNSRREIFKSSEGIFLVYRDDEVIRDAIHKCKTESPQKTAEEICADVFESIDERMSNCKLHISFNAAIMTSDYKHIIADVICNHIDKIIAFKRASNHLMQSHTENLLRIRSLLVTYQHTDNPTSQMTARVKEMLISNGFGDALSNIDLLIEKINDAVKSVERFKNGDQFTIYLPKDINKEDVLKLCMDLDNEIREIAKAEINPGVILDVSSPITPYISFRQDTLDDVYINAFKLSNESAIESQKREQIKVVQEKNILYLYLKNHFAPTVHISEMWQQKSKSTSESPIKSNDEIKNVKP